MDDEFFSNPSAAYRASLLAMPRQSHPAGAAKLMHPTEISRPIHHAGWVYEEKVDGWRTVATKAEGSVRLVSRNGLDHTRRFPELVKALTALKAATFTLDGEVAVYDQAFISRFEWLRARPTDAPATLPVYMVFDVLECDGRHLREQPLRERRRLLERLVSSHGMVFPARRLSLHRLLREGLVRDRPGARARGRRQLSWVQRLPQGLPSLPAAVARHAQPMAGPLPSSVLVSAAILAGQGNADRGARGSGGHLPRGAQGSRHPGAHHRRGLARQIAADAVTQ